MEKTNNMKLTFGKYSLNKYTIIDVINDINYNKKIELKRIKKN